MRKAILITGGLIGVLILAVVGLFIYAALNLNALIKANRGYLLARMSDSLGRPVEARDIRVSLGWGVMMDVTGVKVGDDRRFSQIPFIEASDVYGQVEFLPLLFRRLKVTRLVLKDPVVRILRDEHGDLNIETFGKKPGERSLPPAAEVPPQSPAQGGPIGGPPIVAVPPHAKQAKGAGRLPALSVKSFSIENGRLYYRDARMGGPSITVSRLDLDVANFGFASPFDAHLKLAAFGDRQNLSISGKIGPLMRAGALDFASTPVDLVVVAGPVTLEQLKALPKMADALPHKLSIVGPVTVRARGEGSLDSLRFSASTDLGSNAVVYAQTFEKAAGTAFQLTAEGVRRAGRLELNRSQLTLADLQLKAANVSFEGGGNWAARLDSNRFDLGSLARMLVALSKYKLSGQAEIHADVKMVRAQPNVTGTVALWAVAATPPGRRGPGLSNLTGNVTMSGNSAKVGPLNFNLGLSHARLQANVESIEPVRASYDFNADAVKLAELMAGRQDNEQLNGLSASGTVAGTLAAPDVSVSLNSPSGMVADVPYRTLALSADLAGKRLTIKSLKANAYSGAIAANGEATITSAARFALALNCENIDLQQALESQKAKAAGIVRGKLTGQVQVSGAGGKFEQIKPTLKGQGRLAVRDGKLVGVNIVAAALKKIDKVSGIGALVPESVVANHPELFRSPDTDLQSASLTFTLEGPRLTSHDIAVRSSDYSVHGDGWFDMDKNIDMNAHILLSRQFSDELRAQKKNVVYLVNRDGEVDIPLKVTGVLPKPSVRPDIEELARRATTHLVEKQGEKLLKQFLPKKGLGGILGGGSGGGAATPSAPTPTPSNPLAPLRNLFR